MTNTYKFTVVRRQVVTAQRLICELTAPNPSPSFRDVIFLHENDLGQTEVFFTKNNVVVDSGPKTLLGPERQI